MAAAAPALTVARAGRPDPYRPPALDDSARGSAARDPFRRWAATIRHWAAAVDATCANGGPIVVLEGAGPWPVEMIAAACPGRRVVALVEDADPILGRAAAGLWLERDRSPNLEILRAAPRRAIPAKPSGVLAVVADTVEGHARARRALALADARTSVALVAAEPGALRFLGERDRFLVAAGGDAVIAGSPAVVAALDRAPEPATSLARVFAALHPAARIDLNRLTAALEGTTIALPPADAEALYWLLKGRSVALAAARAGREPAEVAGALRPLEAAGILRLVPASPAMARLGVHLARGEILLPPWRSELGCLAREGFARHAERPFLTVAATLRTLTFAEVARGVDRAAAALRGHGIGKGDVVCLQSAVTPEAGMALWAALGLGAVVVPLNLTWPAPVAAEVYASCRPRLVMADAERAASALSGWEGEAVLLDDGPVDASIAGRATRFSDWMGASQREPAPLAPIDPEATAVVLYTSGTTGAPKGVELSHGALVRSAHLIARTYGFGPDDVLLSPGDLHTIAGLRNSFVLPLMTGTRVILPSAEDRASFLGIVELIRRHRVTVAKVVPRLLRRLAQHADRVDPADLASLRLVLSGTAPLHRFTLDGLATVIRAPVQDYLGISETAGAALFGPFEGSGSVATDGGLPIDLMARIVDADGRPLGVGEVGEIRLYGDRLMRGYLGQPELTEAVLRDGWYRTGDLGAWGEDGRLHLRGRAREAIKIMCGEVVYPVEIEQLIAEDASVREVAVVGFRNRDGDDRLAAFVLREGGADEAFLDAVAARIEARLGRTKVPHRTLVLDDFPRGTHGKVLKDVLVATYLSDE